MGAMLFPDDLHDRTEFIELSGDAEGAAAVGSWTLALYWLHRNARPERSLPADRLAEVAATPAVAQRLVDVGLWEIDGVNYTPALVDREGCPLWRRVNSTRPSRPAIPPEVRAAVMLRDNRRCVLCGSADDLAMDHIHPWSLGGPDTVENLRVLCRSCNSRKGARIQ